MKPEMLYKVIPSSELTLRVSIKYSIKLYKNSLTKKSKISNSRKPSNLN